MESLSIKPGDIWGGLAAMLVALPSAIAFGVLVYASVDPSYAAQGALFGMLGAAALGLVAPLCGRTPALVTAPCAPAAAILAALAAELVSQGEAPERVVGLLALTALLAAALLAVYGLLKGGRFIKYIPYPVVSGYLSGVGVIITLGQLPNLFGLPDGVDLVVGLTDPFSWSWQSLVVGATTVVATACAPRLTDRVPGVILGLCAGISAYFALALTLAPDMLVNTNPQLVGPLDSSGSVLLAVTTQFQALRDVRSEDLALIAYAALTLSALLSIDTLKTCVVLDAVTGARHNSNRELLGQSAGNFAAFAIGGMPGAGTMGPTLVNVSSGASTYRSGLLEGAFTVLVLLALGSLIAWIPIAALAGILLVVAFRMFDWSVFGLLRYPETRFDFAVVATVVLVAVTIGLIAASGAGVALAILLFIRDQIRGSVLRKRATLKEISSKLRRPQREREILVDEGDVAVVVELQGNLFFGTTDQLFTELETDLRACRWLLFDMRRVQSMDYTAANLFRQMHRRLQARDGTLLLCGMPSQLAQRQDIQRYLLRVGLLGVGADALEVFETRDEGLEWIENQILDAAGLAPEQTTMPLELREIEFLRDLDTQTLSHLAGCVRPQSAPAGARIFSRGDAGDELYLVRSGTVRILLPLPHGKQHHLATIGRGDFFGEMAFLDAEARSADAEATTDCELYVLSRAEFDRHLAAAGSGAARVFESLARAVSLRLRSTDAELRASEDR